MLEAQWLNIAPKQTLLGYYKSIIELNQLFPMMMAIIDIILVVTLIYTILKVIKNTRVLQLFKGRALLLVINFLSDIFKLPIIHGILSSLTTYGVLILVIIFQPELRKMLEQIGTNKLSKFLGITNYEDENKIKDMIYKIAVATTDLSKTKTGALIVIERDIKLKEIIDSGIRINSDISVQLLKNIFVKDTPLHDGAVVISGGKIKSACSILPLSDDDINKSFGTRHRAALGISKNSDAITVVVSEETGKVSVAKNNTLIVDVKEDVLKKILLKNMVVENKAEKNNIVKKMSKAKEKLQKINSVKEQGEKK